MSGTGAWQGGVGEDLTDEWNVTGRNPRTGATKVLCGGSWADRPDDAGMYKRSAVVPTQWGRTGGFRCVASQRDWQHGGRLCLVQGNCAAMCHLLI